MLLPIPSPNKAKFPCPAQDSDSIPSNPPEAPCLPPNSKYALPIDSRSVKLSDKTCLAAASPTPMNQPDPAHDSTFRSIMVTDPPVLAPETTVAAAAAWLLQNHLLSMPVVDSKRHYLGLFSKRHLIACLLPAVATHDGPRHQVERLIEAGMLQDTLEEIRERYAAIADKPVSEHLDASVSVLRPDQP